MAKKKDSTTETPKTKTPENQNAGQGQQPTKHVAVVTQYIKDLSFENPRAPQSLLGAKERPQISVNVDVKAATANEEQGLYEVTLTIATTAKAANETLFVTELSYAGLFSATGLNAGEREQALLIYAPSILFPFARRVIADATRDGGFPPLMLDPVDFAQIYLKRKQATQAKKQA